MTPLVLGEGPNEESKTRTLESTFEHLACKTHIIYGMFNGRRILDLLEVERYADTLVF